MNPPRSIVHRARDSAGFSGIDLLGGLAGLSLVTVLGLGCLAHSARQARLTRCTSNLGRVGEAVLQSAADHEQSLPGPVAGQSGDLWWWYRDQVQAYVGVKGVPGSVNESFACPDDRGYTDSRPFHANPRFDFTSYVFNGVTLPGAPNVAGRTLDTIRQPRRTLLVMEFTAHAPLSWHRSRTGRHNAPFYSDAENVTAFVDGHVGLTPIYYDGYNAAYTQDPIAGYSYQFSGD